VLGADGRLSLLRTTVSDALSDPDERFSLSFFADAARTTALSPALTVQVKEPRVGSPSDGSDVITGSAAAETISGVPADSTLYGKGSIDRLTGGGGADMFILGSASGRYYDGDATTGLAILSDFSVGLDMVQLNGIASNYILNNGRYNSINGVFISLANGGDRIGFVEGLRTTGINPLNLNDPAQFRYFESNAL
jgi:Ca2+-binding RTX toxin-like protein